MALTLRQFTGGSVAFSVWLLSDQTIRVSKISQIQYDEFAVTRKGLGDAPGKPTVDAKFLMAAGGIPALNTADGWPSAEDAWEVNDPEIGRYLVVATGSTLDFTYTMTIASPPVNRRSQLSGVRVKSVGNRQVFRQGQYNRNRLDLLVLTEVPVLERENVSGEIDNHRSVTFDAQSQGTINGSASSLTLSHVIANQSNGYLAALSSQRAGQTLNTVTYNGDSLTSLLNVVSVSARAEYYYRLAPDIGTANIVFTYNANTSCVAGGISAYGVDQSTPHTDSDSQATTFGNNPTLTLTSAVGELAIANGCGNPPGTPTPDATWTTAWNAASTGGNNRGGVAQYRAGAASSVTITITGWTASDCCIVGASLKAASAGGTEFTLDVSGQTSPSASLTKSVGKTSAGASSPFAAIGKLVGKSTDGSMSPSGGGTFDFDKFLAGQTSLSGSISSGVAKAFDGVVSPIGSIVHATGKAFAGVVSPVGTIVRDISKTLSGIVSPTAEIAKQILKAFAGSISPSGTFTNGSIYLQVLDGLIAPLADLFRLTGKGIGGSSNPTGAGTLDTTKQLSGIASPTGIATKDVSKTYNGSIQPSGVLTTVIGAFIRPMVIKITGSLIRTIRLSGSIQRAIVITGSIVRRIRLTGSYSNDE